MSVVPDSSVSCRLQWLELRLTRIQQSLCVRRHNLAVHRHSLHIDLPGTIGCDHRQRLNTSFPQFRSARRTRDTHLGGGRVKFAAVRLTKYNLPVVRPISCVARRQYCSRYPVKGNAPARPRAIPKMACLTCPVDWRDSIGVAVPCCDSICPDMILRAPLG